ncbi:MAG: sugar transferase, partial [Anaerolineales bacterium]|nr:sugar transferase [Anaerolineales bacterium]
ESAAMAGSLAMLVGGVYLLTPRLTPFLPDRRLFIFLLPLLAATFVIFWRAAYANFITQPTFQRRLLIIGAGQSGEALVNALGAKDRREGETAYNIVGFIDDEPDKLNQLVANVPVLGNRYDLLNLARRLQPDEIVVAITHGHLIHPNLFKAVLDCREMGIPITTMAHLYEDLTGRVPVEHAGHDLQVVMPINRPASHRLYLAVRRAIEVVVALLGCLQLLLVIPFVWLANRFSAPGDLFYRQERVGEGGRVFNVIKFRSMIMNAEQGTGAVFAQKNDDRITPVGRFLRKTRLDELPQFWNVLKGEMSLIGPRPERPAIIATLEKEIPFYRVRHAVKPGITGWAQVCYRYGVSVDDSLVKLEYDLYYIKHQSWLLDLSIMVKTARVMLGFQGQ